ncbi:MAG: FMN-binding protein [Thermodesulfobacteriota bacterium]|nr:FMN-binding protein [Thermodesulfobacteriota bacterium]
MKDIIKMVVVLTCICGVAGISLAYLKTGTAATIEKQVLINVQGPAIAAVLGDIDNDPIADRKKLDLPDGSGQVTVFPGKKGGQLVAVALENYGGGFGGDVGVMVGFNTSLNILTGVSMTTMSETPGIGTRVKERSFTKQFKKHQSAGIELDSNGGDIVAVSGATISSTGSVVAVQNAVKAYDSLKDQITGSF